MYCENCKMTFEGGRCPACGSKNVRSALPEDICFLTETDPMFGGMLQDVLEQNRIPVFKNSALGAGMALRVGPMFDRIRFYVPCENLPAAMELVEELFRAPAVPELEGEDCEEESCERNE